MPRYFPLSLNLENRLCVVVGGGLVAQRKVLSLLSCGAKIRLVSPEATALLQDLASAGDIEYIAGNYRPEYMDGAFLAVCAAGPDEVNIQACRDAEGRGMLVNVVDRPALGNFATPAVMHRGSLKMAVSTDGKSPLLARVLKDRLEDLFPAGYGELVNTLGECRREIIKRVPDPEKKQKLLAAMLDDEVVSLMAGGLFDKAKERIISVCNGGGGEPPDSSG